MSTAEQRSWARKWAGKAWWLLREPGFLVRNRPLRQRRKFLYVQTPPPEMANVGDHAQAVAIRRWFLRHFPDVPIVEATRSETARFLDAFEAIMTPDDVIFLQSGGNVNDFAVFSESVRRSVITRFPDHRIIVLPQTIAFRDTDQGRYQEAVTKAIYATHPNLTLCARDTVSEQKARMLFPRALIHLLPDFVMSLPAANTPAPGGSGTLVCVRHDGERLLNEPQTEALMRSLPRPTRSDTWIPRIRLAQRSRYLREMLEQFRRYDAVVTDRFHGMIFSALARVPCVAIPANTHKIASAMAWFRDTPFIRFTADLGAVTAELERAKADTVRRVPDWGAKYFDPLPHILGLEAYTSHAERSRSISSEVRTISSR
ncbi:MAG TPA: polysaccharide pyruvyl transferase family protein [Gemmatimonadales bacterium]|nr:polysaccharide pyruvyl transferase family protein [Gemmatimonadales bacterium]